MKTMAEHFGIVNNETLFGIHNKGMVVRDDMYSMQQKIPQQFGNQQKLVYNYNNKNTNIKMVDNNFTTSSSEEEEQVKIPI